MTIEISPEMRTHLQLVVADRIETLKQFITQLKQTPPGARNSAMLTKLETDLQRTETLLHHITPIIIPSTVSI